METDQLLSLNFPTFLYFLMCKIWRDEKSFHILSFLFRGTNTEASMLSYILYMDTVGCLFNFVHITVVTKKQHC